MAMADSRRAGAGNSPMTKSRRATSEQRRAPNTDVPLNFTPRIRELIDDAECDRFIEKRMSELKSLQGAPQGDLWGDVSVLMLCMDVYFEAAFARIVNLEAQLKKARRMETKSLEARFSLDDLQVEQVDDRRVRLVLARGEDEASFELKFPVMLDRGIWSDRAHYEQGDAVSDGGSLWVAQRGGDLGKPGQDQSGWRLAVKRGRDGRDAK